MTQFSLSPEIHPELAAKPSTEGDVKTEEVAKKSEFDLTDPKDWDVIDYYDDRIDEEGDGTYGQTAEQIKKNQTCPDPDYPSDASLDLFDETKKLEWDKQFTKEYKLKEGEHRITRNKLYKGELVDGKMSGKGKYWDKEGLEFEGDFVNGMVHGFGVKKLRNGDVYTGTFNRGWRHGKGKQTKINAVS